MDERRRREDTGQALSWLLGWGAVPALVLAGVAPGPSCPGCGVGGVVVSVAVRTVAVTPEWRRRRSVRWRPVVGGFEVFSITGSGVTA